MIAEWLVDVGVIAWLSDPFNSGYLGGVATVMLGAGLYSLARLPFLYRKRKKWEAQFKADMEKMRLLGEKASQGAAGMTRQLASLPHCPECAKDLLVPVDLFGMIVEVECHGCGNELHAICQEGGVALGKIMSPQSEPVPDRSELH